jgi:hypothetical protein
LHQLPYHAAPVRLLAEIKSPCGSRLCRLSLPHNFIGKYIAKADNGWHHSKGSTLQNFHAPIMIKAPNAGILQNNCLACHEDLAHQLVANVNGSAE